MAIQFYQYNNLPTRLTSTLIRETGLKATRPGAMSKNRDLSSTFVRQNAGKPLWREKQLCKTRDIRKPGVWVVFLHSHS